MFWILLFAPLAGALLNGLWFQDRRVSDKTLSGWIGTVCCFVSFLSGCFYFFSFQGNKNFFLFSWMKAGSFSVDFSFQLNPLSLLMVLLITGVGSLIHFYSQEYMKGDRGKARYFSFLNLFVFFMLVLVLADSLPLLFVGWEGVGLCSYLLIGFWFKDFKKVNAGMRAFLVNRVGDACFLLGMFFLFLNFETLEFSELNKLFQGKEFDFFHPVCLAAILLFFGAAGKSAQAPLYFWLPSAMAGPTPVSALIHAATMVTAGVYMVVRLFGLYGACPGALSLMGWVGGVTALCAALVAMRQWDFKRILAWSTISQLAYMFMALGVGAFPSGVFHLLTHGFFKALLFLCAGSVIHGLGGEQDIRKMGGLKKYFPKTFWPFMVGALSLIALPPFSGFFSKDDILWSLFSSGSYGLWSLASLTALCTAFYVTRLTVLVFFGKENFDTAHPPHEGTSVLWAPLMVLAFAAVFSGGLGVPHLFSELLPGHPPPLLSLWLKDFTIKTFTGPLWVEGLLMTGSVLASLIVVGFTARYFLIPRPEKKNILMKILEQAFYVDQLLRDFVVLPFKNLALILYETIDTRFLRLGIDALVLQVFSVRKVFSGWQNGSIHSYAFYFVLGLGFLLTLIFIR